MRRLEIAKEFNQGLLAALSPLAADPTRSKHWQAGYRAGRTMLAIRQDHLNQYMRIIGYEPFGVLHLASAKPERKKGK